MYTFTRTPLKLGLDWDIHVKEGKRAEEILNSLIASEDFAGIYTFSASLDAMIAAKDDYSFVADSLIACDEKSRNEAGQNVASNIRRTIQAIGKTSYSYYPVGV